LRRREVGSDDDAIRSEVVVVTDSDSQADGATLLDGVERGCGSGPRRRINAVSLEVIEHQGTTYAEIIWAGTNVEKTRFFSPAESSFQFGLLAHTAGYQEEPHYHKTVQRTINDLQQMFVVQRGIVDVQLFTDDNRLFREVRLHPGDAIVLVHGSHAIRVVEDFQALSVKQGPFFGDEIDKVVVELS
jgi:hypothetical protein